MEVYGGQVVARTLKELGMQHTFGIFGHPIQVMVAAICEEGMKFYIVRHEQTASFAADGWSRGSRSVGVCCSVTAPGLANLVPGIFQAYLCRSPVVALIGGHELSHDRLGTMQECYAAEMYRPIAKWTQRVGDWSMLNYYIRRAFRDAMTYPPGPVVLELPWNILVTRGEDNQQFQVPIDQLPPAAKSAGDPVLVERVVKRLLETERAMLEVGDAAHWSGCSKELLEFVELMNLPVHTVRLGRGAVPEDHPLAVTAENVGTSHFQAEVIAIIGLEASWLNDWFEPPTWSHDARYIQIQGTDKDVFLGLPTETVVLGDCKLVLKQMIECAKSLKTKRPERESWLKTLKDAKERGQRRADEGLKAVYNNVPIHPNRLTTEVVEALDKDASIIFDGFTTSAWLTQKIKAKFTGQDIDAGLYQAFGHGVGMGMGVQLARPGKQVCVLLGDGGTGVAGMDIETAKRYNLPVVYVISNNSALVGDMYRQYYYPEHDSWQFLPGIRYDRMFKEFGCYTEYVESPDEIRPAITRAFESGITSVVNVAVDPNVIHPFGYRMALLDTWVRDSRSKLPQEALDLFQQLSPRELQWVKKRLDQMSISVSLETLRSVAGITEQK